MLAECSATEAVILVFLMPGFFGLFWWLAWAIQKDADERR